MSVFCKRVNTGLVILAVSLDCTSKVGELLELYQTAG